MKIVRNPNRWLKKLSRAAALISLAMSTQSAFSQDGDFSFGRTPTGSASEVIDSNRDGFGMSFRGGHIAGETVGRQESITHINLMPYFNVEDGLLFGDSRLMRANEGGLAWTFGGGYRHYIADWDVVVGGNGYFDRDELTGAHLKQWGAGAELLAQGWEARGNFYQAFGNTFDTVGDPSVDQGSVAFVGQNISFTRLDQFAQALSGVDAEFGMLLPGSLSERIDLRAFGGAYYYEGDITDGFAGWSSRLQADIGSWLELGLKLTNDEVYDTTVSFAATVHFGGFSSQEHTKRSAIQRFRDPVRRNMNVVTLESTTRTPGQLAMNSQTGNPFTVAHVNSNDLSGPFNGTVEDPFALLSSGLASGRDIVFVHAGSRFDSIGQNSVTLADGQSLIGEGFILSENPNLAGGRPTETSLNVTMLGRDFPLILPKSPTFAATPTLSRPTLFGAAGNGVTMANNSLLAGMIIDSTGGNGIVANNVQNIQIDEVRVNSPGGSGILLRNTHGNVSVSDTSILTDTGTTAPSLYVDGGDSRITFTSSDQNLLGFIKNTGSGQAALLIEDMLAAGSFVMGGSSSFGGSSITDVGGRGVIILNNEGSATIDNLSVTNSLSNGISITNSSGNYIFAKTQTSLLANVINGATDAAVFLSNASGNVSFVAPLQILNRQSAGIEMTQSSGTVAFRQNVTIRDHAVGGTGAAVWFHNNTGDLSFDRNLVITSTAPALNSHENGILIENNTSTSLFSAGITGANASIQINGTDDAAFLIRNNAGDVNLNNLVSTTIDDRLQEGMVILNSSGTMEMGTVSVQNTQNAEATAIDIRNNSGGIRFRRAVVSNGLTGGLVNIAEAVDFANTASSDTNTAGGINMERNTGRVGFTDLDVETIGGIGIRGRANTLIQAGDGDILTTGARAIDIRGDLQNGTITEGGINITLNSVTSSGSLDYGIVLVETNDPNDKTFIIKPDPIGSGTIVNVGDGGTISNALGNADDDLLGNEEAAGVFLRNGGQVELNNMILQNNEVGVFVSNTETPGATVADTKEQYLKIFDSEITDSDIRGIQTVDLMQLEIAGTAFDNNGDDAAEGSETIRIDYTTPVDTSTSWARADRPFEVFIYDTVNNTSRFTIDAGDAIRIVQQPGALHSVLRLRIFDTEFAINDTTDPTTLPPANNQNGDDRPLIDDAVVVDWDGALRVNLTSNNFQMDAIDAQQRVFSLINGDTDRNERRLTELAIQNNIIVHNNLFGLFEDGSINARIDGLADVLIAENAMLLSQFRASAINLDMRGEDSDVLFRQNLIQFDGERGTAILIDQAANNSFFAFQRNVVDFFDDATGAERGFIIASVRGGTIGVGGTGNLMNATTPGLSNGNGLVEVLFRAPAGSVRAGSQVQINGALFP